MTTQLSLHRAREAQKAAQRSDRDQRRRRVIETTASTWWPENKPTRCISCNAPIHKEPTEGEGLPCGH